MLTTGVRSAYAQTPADEIPPLSPPLPEIAPTLWEQFGWVLWILVPLLLLMAGVIVWLALRPGKPPVLPATAAQARVALQALQSQPETGAVLSQISQVMRRYLINTFWLSPLEMTTSEFCALLSRHEHIGPELAVATGKFLKACDELKFSPNPVPPPLSAPVRALELIEMAEQRRLVVQTAIQTGRPT